MDLAGNTKYSICSPNYTFCFIPPQSILRGIYFLFAIWLLSKLSFFSPQQLIIYSSGLRKLYLMVTNFFISCRPWQLLQNLHTFWRQGRLLPVYVWWINGRCISFLLLGFSVFHAYFLIPVIQAPSN